MENVEIDVSFEQTRAPNEPQPITPAEYEAFLKVWEHIASKCESVDYSVEGIKAYRHPTKNLICYNEGDFRLSIVGDHDDKGIFDISVTFKDGEGRAVGNNITFLEILHLCDKTVEEHIYPK